ncbi:MAG: 2-oxo acid dehydrogenase subunit E2 [Bacteroidetes bacterium]|nr:2-oxo acid dehydrogenase subunit E2 [Bacteroidota bacterium]
MKQISLTLPKIGESVASATILKWFKKEGDMIALDEIFVEISTDKVDSELPSPYSGKLSKILIQAGEEAKVGQAICILEGEFKDSASHADSPQESSAPVSIASSGSNSSKRKIDVSPSNHAVVERGDVFLSPLVRKIVAKENLTEAEIQSIRGTGRHGRITQEDILNLLRNRAHHLEQLQYTPNQPSEKQETHHEKTLPVDEGDEVVVFERMRQLIADHMLQSKRDSPHCTSFTEVDVTGVVDWRDAHKSSFEKEHGVKLTYTHVFMHCAIQALAEFPMLNAWNQKKGYILKKKINLGFATALPTGNLIVPNIKIAGSSPWLILQIK